MKKNILTLIKYYRLRLRIATTSWEDVEKLRRLITDMRAFADQCDNKTLKYKVGYRATCMKIALGFEDINRFLRATKALT
jgi:hypothetical protein